MMAPGVDATLAAVIQAIEDDIAHHVADEYAQSMCRTVAQVLRSVRVRVQLETEVTAEDNADLRSVLAAVEDGLPADVRSRVAAAVAAQPLPRLPTSRELTEDARRLRQALAEAIEATPDEQHPARQAAREYIGRHLARERLWAQDAYTGPRR